MTKKKRQWDFPHARLLKLLQIIEELKTTRMSIKQIAEKYYIGLRTAYRYMEIIELCDLPLEIDFERKYFINNETNIQRPDSEFI